MISTSDTLEDLSYEIGVSPEYLLKFLPYEIRGMFAEEEKSLM